MDVLNVDKPEALPTIAEDMATRLALTDVKNKRGGVKYYASTPRYDAFHAYSLEGRDAAGRRVYITAYNT